MSDVLHAEHMPKEGLWAIHVALEAALPQNARNQLIINLGNSWASARRWSNGKTSMPHLYSFDLAALLLALAQVATDAIASEQRCASGRGLPPELVAGQSEAREKLIEGALVAVPILAEALAMGAKRMEIERAAARAEAERPAGDVPQLLIVDEAGRRIAPAKPIDL